MNKRTKIYLSGCLIFRSNSIDSKKDLRTSRAAGPYGLNFNG